MYGAVLVSLVMLLAMAVVPAAAAPPLDFTIDSEASLSPDPDPFTASGPAEEAGAVCPSGVSVDDFVTKSGPPGGSFLNLFVVKTFTCDDASGTFRLRLLVRLDLATNETTANWQVVGGTGNYENLRGRGTLIGTPIVEGISINDVYTGRLH